MVLLEATDVVHYLLSRGLITRECVVEGDLVIIDVSSRRNRNFKIRQKHAPGLFVKQPRTWTPDALGALRREARCYQLAQSNADFAALAPLVPTLLHYDDRSQVLVVELIGESENLREHHQRLGRFASDVAEQLGTALGKYHAGTTVRPDAPTESSVFPGLAPWILSFHSQPIRPDSRRGAVLQLSKILRQYPEFMRQVDELRNTWRFDCLIHGDMKWDNCLVYPRDSQDGRVNLKIVDWELADFGDSCWDIGAILQAYLSSWVLSIPDTGMTPATILVDQAQYKLDDMQPAISAFWQAYAMTRQIGAEAARDLLERSMRYGAARMIQTVFELSTETSQLSPFAVRLLQLSDNILANPKEAVEHLLAA